jgi:hypothetical protein
MRKSNNLLAVDSGVHKHAIAYFYDGVFQTASDHEPVFDLVDKTFRVVIERPEIYPGRASEKRQRDLMDLTLAAGELGGTVRRQGAEVKYVLPRTWKGQVCKPIHHSRILRALVPVERARFEDVAQKPFLRILSKVDAACERYARTGKVTGYRWDLHNILDAVGIGLWALGRTGKGGALVQH